MKKIFTLLVLSLFCMMTANAQGYNLFDPADVDENGWLWFDTQAKIDKYIGLCNEDDYTVDPNGKYIQLAFANITPDYPETVADPDIVGVGYDGVYDTDGAKKGAIILAAASSMSSATGGCIILNLPSCESIGLYLSSEATMLGQSLKLDPNYALDDNGDGTGNTKVIYSRATVFGKLSSAGHYQWESAATDNNSNNTGVNFVSDSNVYFALRNCHRYTVFVHGVKVMTKTPVSTGINEMTNNNVNAKEGAYTVDGKYVGSLKLLPKGVYIVKKGNMTQKVIK